MSIDKNTIEIEKIKEALEEINEQIDGLDGRIISNELTLKNLMSEYILQLKDEGYFNFADCVQLGEFSTLEEAFNYLLKHLNDVEIKEYYLNHFEYFEIIKIRKENKNKIVATGELNERNDNLYLKIHKMSEID